MQGTRNVGVPIAISDPGPFSLVDFLELPPGAQIEFGRISYTRALEKLPPGDYAAFILFLFWRDPTESYAMRCRSTSAHFTMYK
jgi:hypothetical protein